MSLGEEDKAWIENLFSILNAKIDHTSDALQAQLHTDLEALETKLLTAFHRWASPLEARVRSHSAVLQALDAELGAISDRLKAAESKTAA
jgi:hypothetical protein